MARAKRLCMRLTQDQEEKILVILDDVWQRLDFEAIGIPSGKNRKGFKVLITTRSERVCTSMDCQRKIYLSVLTDDEAWALFQKKAQISEGTSDTIKNLASQISKECSGLPVAITAVASTLKGQDEEECKVALARLKGSKPVDIGEGFENPYNCLQLSYDYLKQEEAKSLFLLCSVFPEDYEIPVEDLTRFAIGLGVVREVYSYEEARNEVSVAKKKLISSCLLLSHADATYKKGECCKMHDLVRDVAHWIAKNENKVIKCALDKDRTVDHRSPRYLWCEQFPNDLDCSNLEFLCIQTYWEVSVEIFKGMGKLRVLFLYNKDRWERRPLSTILFKSLTNLRCLVLENWELGDISFVGYMKKLESLALRNCSSLESPNVATQPTNLRLLDLSECNLERNHFEVIGIHPQLEELYTARTGYTWDVYDENIVEFFNKFGVPQELQRYQILLGTPFRYYQEMLPNHHRTLILSYFNSLNAALKDLAKKAEVLFMERIQGGAKNIIPDIVQIEEGGMNELIRLQIRDSEEIECLVDNGNHLREVGTLFSKLLILRIERMKHLGALYLGRLPPSGLFQKLEKLYLGNCPKLHGILFVEKVNLRSLKVLKLFYCPKLTSLFTPVVAESLVQLEELGIAYCDGLKQILADDDILEEISTDGDKLLFPNLKRLNAKWCRELEYIIPVTFAQGLPQLEFLEVERTRKLKYVFGQCMHGDESQNELKVELPALEELKLARCPNIIAVSRENCYVAWPSLRQFDLLDCPEFATISKLNLCNVKALKLVESPKLTSLFTPVVAGSLAQLEELEISGCDGLKQILADNDKEEISADGQKLLFPKLKWLYVRGCGELENIIPVTFAQGLLRLKCLKVERTPKLKYVFGQCIHGDQLADMRQNVLKIELPALEELELACFTNIIGVCPENYYVVWPSLRRFTLVDCPEFVTISKLNLCSVKALKLVECPKLTSLFTPVVARSLVQLEELKISGCDGLKQILADDYKDDHRLLFPKLRRLYVMGCSELEYIIPVTFAQGLLQLKSLEVEHIPKLKYVFDQCIHGDQSQNELKIELPALDELKLARCPNIIGVCPENCHAACPCLRRFILLDCPEFATTSKSPTQSMDFQNLQEMVAVGCRELKSIFAARIAGGLRQLKELRKENCNQLNQIINDEGRQHFTNLHLESNQKEELPKATSISLAPVRNYKSGTHCRLHFINMLE